MSEHTAENDALRQNRYAEVHVPLGGSNVRSIVLTTCRDCGAFVFSRRAHDDHHARPIPPRSGVDR